MIPAALQSAAGTVVPADPPLIQGAGPGAVDLGGHRYVNLAACDYLGLARHPQVLGAAVEALRTWGLGAAATRVLSGSTEKHRELERRLAGFVGCEDAVLHSSCWSANAGVFGTLAELAKRSGSSLAIFSDGLNHASLIDGIRTIRPQVSRLETFDHEDGVDGLRALLEQHDDERAARVIVTDGVFSMEGDHAPLQRLVSLASEFEAVLIVDDSHGTGVLGDHGRGTMEAEGVLGEVDVVTGTLGKALGGAGGGFVAASSDFATAVRGLSRPYTFSNNPPYSVVAAALAALDLLETDDSPLAALRDRTRRLRSGLAQIGLETVGGEHAIVPLILGDEDRTAAVAASLQARRVYATPMVFPIVGRGEARIRMQVSAAHREADIDQVLHALTDPGPERLFGPRSPAG